jgi:hypothetical protein
MMNYKFSIGLEAKAVPEPLGQWLENNLPVDFSLKPRTRLRLRFLEVTITGNTTEDVAAKLIAFVKVVRACGFRGVVVKDKKIQRI